VIKLAHKAREAHPELLGIADWSDDPPLLETFDQYLAPRLAHRAGGFRKMYELMADKRRPVLVETGCMRSLDNWAGDGMSTFVLDVLARHTGGELYSVDYDEGAVRLARSVCSDSTNVMYAESIHWLLRCGRHIDLIYLDSMDFVQKKPWKSAMHHLFELTAAMRWLRRGAVVAVDDMERDDYGKGALINEFMAQAKAERVYAGYQYIWVLP
jgi:hypothetical protein